MTSVLNIDQLEIPQSKVKDYLLDINHPDGWSKAKFHLARGFSRAVPEVLADALAVQGFNRLLGIVISVSDGTKFKVIGPLACPDGTSPDVLTIWKSEPGSASASFVTARPHKRKSP